MSFSYDFQLPRDTVHFAYCIPYTYSRLLKLITHLPCAKELPPLKTLSGLAVPVLMITDHTEEEHNKQVVLVTGRVHPGESNSSFVAEGMLEYLCGNEGRELRRSYIFYVLPMLNPDGVVVGNYRTSLFGKDLNRTFDQSRKFAFPETFYLVEFAQQLKAKHKKRFNLYIDLHGHSVKKNVFMYGPDFSIQHSNYEISRQLPHLLGNMTSFFRYYSCVFRISSEKATTARAIFNRSIDVPFTYTMQSSNGFYYDPVTRTEIPFTAKKWREMGVYLCKALGMLRFDQNNRIKRSQSHKIEKDVYHSQNDKHSDDEISQGKSDSEPEDEDLSEKQLQLIEASIGGKTMEMGESRGQSSSKQLHYKYHSRELKVKKQRGSVFLPPINTLNRALIFSNRNKKKEIFKQERLRCIDSQIDMSTERYIKPRYSMSQIATDDSGKKEKKGELGLKKETKHDKFIKFRISK